MKSYEERESDARIIYNEGLRRVRESPVPAAQKFPPGTRVKIDDVLPGYMDHFPKGKLATVQYTYAHAYGGDYVKSYSLDIDGLGETAWYEENQLSLVGEEK